MPSVALCYVIVNCQILKNIECLLAILKAGQVWLCIHNYVSVYITKPVEVGIMLVYRE